MAEINIALIGDYSPDVTAHQAIPKALGFAVKAVGQNISYEWLNTRDLTDIPAMLEPFSAVWAVPASPYENMQGALDAIRWAREKHKPFLGTCGGYQHAILEFAHNVLGFKDAQHAEINPETKFPLITPLGCALVEKDGDVTLTDGSKIVSIYGKTNLVEQYRCSYGFNTNYAELFKNSDLKIVGYDLDAEPRVIELNKHPFFVGIAFQPERSALRGKTHPLITAFVKAASL